MGIKRSQIQGLTTECRPRKDGNEMEAGQKINTFRAVGEIPQYRKNGIVGTSYYITYTLG